MITFSEDILLQVAYSAQWLTTQHLFIFKTFRLLLREWKGTYICLCDEWQIELNHKIRLKWPEATHTLSWALISKKEFTERMPSLRRRNCCIGASTNVARMRSTLVDVTFNLSKVFAIIFYYLLNFAAEQYENIEWGEYFMNCIISENKSYALLLDFIKVTDRFII